MFRIVSFRLPSGRARGGRMGDRPAGAGPHAYPGAEHQPGAGIGPGGAEGASQQNPGFPAAVHAIRQNLQRLSQVRPGFRPPVRPCQGQDFPAGQRPGASFRCRTGPGAALSHLRHVPRGAGHSLRHGHDLHPESGQHRALLPDPQLNLPRAGFDRERPVPGRQIQGKRGRLPAAEPVEAQGRLHRLLYGQRRHLPEGQAAEASPQDARRPAPEHRGTHPGQVHPPLLDCQDLSGRR